MIAKHMREKDLLTLLDRKEGFTTAKEISSELGVSPKTVYRLVKRINSSQAGGKTLILSEKGKGLALDRELYLSSARSLQNFQEEYSLLERRNKILERLLLIAPRPVSVYDLAQDYFVSESVILKDKLELQKQLSDYHLKLTVKRQQLSVSGSEFDLRTAIADLVSTFSMIDLDNLSLSKNDSKINYDVASFVLSELYSIERNLKANIPYPYNVNIFSHLYIMIERSRHHNYHPYLVQGSIAYEDTALKIESQRVIDDITQFMGCPISSDEVYYLYSYLISSRFQTEEFSAEQSFSPRVLAITDFYFKHMSITRQQTIKASDGIFRDLGNHISPMLRRLDNKIRIKNGMLEQIKTGYPEIFQELRNLSDKVSERYAIPKINHDEIGFLTLYFVRFKELSKQPLKALVMCSSGIGISELLRTKIENSFSDLEIVDVVSAHNADAVLARHPEVKLLITSVDSRIKNPIKKVLVSALMSAEDKKRIRKAIEELRYEK
ncbi:BglG family transcription antiterminator [Streptococcus orisasini]